MLGGKEREPGWVRGEAEGWEALQLLGSPPAGPGLALEWDNRAPGDLAAPTSYQLPPEAGWLQGGLQGDAAQLGSR